MTDVCDDCQIADRLHRAGVIHPIYWFTRWCCRARHIVDATVSRSAAGETLQHARRSLAESERQMHPTDWERVRDRLRELAAR